MPKIEPTKQALMLAKALEKRGIRAELEHWDGHKHVDLFVPENGMYIEIEGLQHFTDAHQIVADFKRDYYSNKEDHFTLRITNQLMETHLENIADAIFQVVNNGIAEKNPEIMLQR